MVTQQNMRKHTRWAEFLEWVAVSPGAPVLKGYTDFALFQEFKNYLITSRLDKESCKDE